jgi:predicted DNA-binding transcriptional regulator AlpA
MSRMNRKTRTHATPREDMLDVQPMSDFTAHLEPYEPPVSLIRPSKVAHLLGISMTTLWRASKKPGFPKKYQLSPNAVVFRENEVRAWVGRLPVVKQ